MGTQTLQGIESESGFKALFEYATIGIVVAGRSGNIELVNPNAEKLFGYNSAELIGKPVELLIPASLSKKHQHHRENYFSRPKGRPMGLGMELHACKKDGTEFPVEISLGYYELGGEMMAVAFITDITQRQEAEQNLKKINEELENRVQERTLELTQALEREKELNEMKSRFVSLASHEFRTPLSAILSSVSLIDRYADSTDVDKRTKHIERIKGSVKNLTDILNDFLSLDKLEQGKIEIEQSSFDLEDFSKDIIDEIKGMLKPGQYVHYNHNGNKHIIQDKKILKNIMLNLLSNAVKYSGEHQEIKLITAVNNKQVSIEVHDKGIGIPAEEQKHLFTKFYRAKNTSNIQGTGLGLNIVKRYLELLEGEIKFTTGENAGTTFLVEFPSVNEK